VQADSFIIIQILYILYELQVYAFYTFLSFYLSLNSCENIFCQTSIHFCCRAVRGFPGLLKDLVKMSRNLDRNTLMTSIVFQSDTANRALFPSRMKTPAYIYSNFSAGAEGERKPLTSQRTSPQSNAIANSSTAVVSWAL
jgi:hypothetical protein